MPDRVYLHVGVPKTGTTFVQDVLWRGRGHLSRAGVCYPLQRRNEHFAATMDLRGASWGGRRNPDWDGTWDRLARTIRESGAGISVLSSELLAAADEDAVARGVGSFPHHEVHIVLTVRDLARQLVSGWQEHVKHRVAVPLDDFLEGCLAVSSASEQARRLAERFWRLHDVPEVARRWAVAVPAHRLHLVVVPPPGAGRDVLWQRFSRVTGIDPELGRVDPARPNTSLSAADAEVIRAFNATTAGTLSARDYDQVVRVLLAEKVLAGRRPSSGGGPAPALPPRFSTAVRERARATVEALSPRGHDVVGALDELIPGPELLGGARGQEPVGEQALVESYLRAVAGFIVELGPLEQRLRARARARSGPGAGPREGPKAGPHAGPQADARQGRPGTSSEPVSSRPPGAREQRRGGGGAGPVYMHVGAPKTGTTFLQDVLWHHRDALAEDGVLFARRRYDDHFRATLDLRDMTRGGPAAGVWDRVAADTGSWTGTSVISHEFFAAAEPRQVERALRSLGPERVHIVYTARDLWRLLGAEWQEGTKHGRQQSFGTFLDDVLDQGRDGILGSWFWSVHDPVDVLRRWAADLPPERVHVVTAPPRGADRGLLWERFAQVLGIDPGVDTTVARDNRSLGAAEVTFLRLLNTQLGDRKDKLMQAGDYPRFVKTCLAEKVLSARPDMRRYAPPAERFQQVLDRAERIVADLRVAGYSVAGDLSDLVPTTAGAPGRHPDDTTAAELVSVGQTAVAGLVREAVRLRRQHGVGTAEGDEHRSQGDRAGGDATHRLASGRALAGRLARRARSAVQSRTRRSAGPTSPTRKDHNR